MSGKMRTIYRACARKRNVLNRMQNYTRPFRIFDQFDSTDGSNRHIGIGSKVFQCPDSNALQTAEVYLADFSATLKDTDPPQLKRHFKTLEQVITACNEQTTSQERRSLEAIAKHFGTQRREAQCKVRLHSSLPTYFCPGIEKIKNTLKRIANLKREQNTKLKSSASVQAFNTSFAIFDRLTKICANNYMYDFINDIRALRSNGYNATNTTVSLTLAPSNNSADFNCPKYENDEDYFNWIDRYDAIKYLASEPDYQNAKQWTKLLEKFGPFVKACPQPSEPRRKSETLFFNKQN